MMKMKKVLSGQRQPTCRDKEVLVQKEKKGSASSGSGNVQATLNLDEVITALRENERMMRTENVDDEHNAIVMMEYERGRNHLRRHDGPRGRSKSQSHPQRDMSNIHILT